MRCRCPHCDRSLLLPDLPATVRQVKCPACQTRFAPRPAAARVDAAAAPASPAPRRAGRRPATNVVLLAVLGGAGALAVLLVAAVLVLVTVLVRRTAPSPANGPPVPARGPAVVAGPSESHVGHHGPMGTPPGHNPPPPPQLAELFDEAPGRPAPTVLVPVLNRTRPVDFDLPRLAARKGPRPAAAPPTGAAGGKMTLEEIKKAVTFIKVEGGLGAATGSGFVVHADRDGGLVATNCHVVAPAVLRQRQAPAGPAKVTVVFDSGLPAERAAPGEVVAFDRDTDLALLRVVGVARMPRPIDPRQAVAPAETMPVLVCGFPFGEALATGSRSPAVTIGKGSVSSVRRGDQGEVAAVQIDGALNPGNSGGPVVDADGRLAGVAVATIKGSGIGLAIPAADLQTLLEGRVGAPRFHPVGLEGDTAVFQVTVPVLDPLRKVRSVSLAFRQGEEGGPEPARGPGGAWKPLDRASRVSLSLDRRGAAVATVRLPARGGPVTVFQLACATDDGPVLSRPVPYRLQVDAVQTAADAMPLSALSRSPGRFAGQTVVVRGNLFPGAILRGSVCQLQVFNEREVKPMGLDFLTTRDIVTQLGELPRTEQLLPVRLTCRVGRGGANGMTPVRVTQIDFLGRGGRVMKTVPSNEGLSDPLIALNRHPEKYVGQSLTFKALLGPQITLRGPEAQLNVMLPSRQPAANLHFTSSRDLAGQLHEEGLKGEAYPVRLQVKVEDRKFGDRRYVTILKIEFLGAGDKVVKTFQ